MRSSHIRINLWEPRAVRRLPQCRRESWGEAEPGLWPPGECAQKAQSTRRASLGCGSRGSCRGDGSHKAVRARRLFPQTQEGATGGGSPGSPCSPPCLTEPSERAKVPLSQGKQAARAQLQCLKSLLSGSCPLCFPEKVRSLSP